MVNRKGAGRPSKPTAQHFAEGTYRPCRHDKRADLRYPPSTPDMPLGLSASGLHLWGQVIGGTPSDVLRILDSPKLYRLCRLCETWCKLDTLIASGDQSKAAWDRWLKTGRQFDSLGNEFGLDPISRSRNRV